MGSHRRKRIYIESKVTPSKPLFMTAGIKEPIVISAKMFGDIYSYLSNSPSGKKEFIAFVKSTFGTQHTPPKSSKAVWEFDIPRFMQYMLSDSMFGPKLDSLGIDTYEGLVYRVTHKDIDVPTLEYNVV